MTAATRHRTSSAKARHGFGDFFAREKSEGRRREASRTRARRVSRLARGRRRGLGGRRISDVLKKGAHRRGTRETFYGTERTSGEGRGDGG